MPESNSPYATLPASQVADLLRTQLVSVTVDRRRVMLWSAILAAGALMLVGHVESLPWFLSLVPLALLTVWHACLLVRQRRYQAAWDSMLEKSGDNTAASPTRKASAAASARASQELGLGSTPASWPPSPHPPSSSFTVSCSEPSSQGASCMKWSGRSTLAMPQRPMRKTPPVAAEVAVAHPKSLQPERILPQLVGVVEERKAKTKSSDRQHRLP